MSSGTASQDVDNDEDFFEKKWKIFGGFLPN